MGHSLTITQLDNSASQWIEHEAQRTGVAVEDVVRKLIYRGLELEVKKGSQQRYHDLDSLAGTWSMEDVTGFNIAITELNQIDQNL